MKGCLSVLGVLVVIALGVGLAWEVRERSRLRGEMEAAFAAYDLHCAERYRAIPNVIRLVETLPPENGPASPLAAIEAMSSFKPALVPPTPQRPVALRSAYEAWTSAQTLEERASSANGLEQEVERFFREAAADPLLRTNTLVLRFQSTITGTRPSLDLAFAAYFKTWSNYMTRTDPKWRTF